MKRYLSLVLVIAMMTTLIVPGLSFTAGADDIAGDRVVAEMTDTAPALDEAITEEVLGHSRRYGRYRFGKHCSAQL